MTIGEHIKQERKKRGWTQAKLAKKANIALVSVQYYEEGRALPSTLSLIGLADAFGISLDQLVGRKVADGSTGN